ncbi:uncharacterized protein BDR25DRAFT_363682 [Lindgomyces ingoldianus]|uniref:Uncharacterized protein n=1 Tax=Lindgomyces ingoldianus TaxID=673940 RepID=A0ACB6Q838_9PLEO|nr:uncharacterized protein BDR25DRAFT_363682 [Lindgomyces ingoldianus]KAF2462685.1 hypothetical protein BDR25DRAFT_363682 [Lindgomyces ingoldianus]
MDSATVLKSTTPPLLSIEGFAESSFYKIEKYLAGGTIPLLLKYDYSGALLFPVILVLHSYINGGFRHGALEIPLAFLVLYAPHLDPNQAVRTAYLRNSMSFPRSSEHPFLILDPHPSVSIRRIILKCTRLLFPLKPTPTDMSSLMFTRMLLASTMLGAATHLAIFIRGEWHMQAPLLNVSITTGSLSICYALGLFTSISIYRRYFHQLRHFPGPWAAAITKFWHIWKCRAGKNYLVIEELHKKYGPFIGTSLGELTIVDPSVPPAVDGPKNNRTKADNGFSTKALSTYKERVIEYADTLTRRIEQLA